jgi:hypothetical protein
MILCALSLVRIVEVAFHMQTVRFKLWYESYLIEREGKTVHPRSYVEEQANYNAFRMKEQIENMMRLALSLGYVLIFGVVAPILVPLVFFLFVIQVRATAVRLTNTAKRVVPLMSVGMGAWQETVNFLGQVGVVFQAFLFVSFGNSFQDTSLIARGTGFVLYGIGAVLVMKIVDSTLSSVDEEALLLERRRHHTQVKVQAASGSFVSKQLAARNTDFARKISRSSDGSLEEACTDNDDDWHYRAFGGAEWRYVKKRQWAKIPRLDELSTPGEDDLSAGDDPSTTRASDDPNTTRDES